MSQHQTVADSNEERIADLIIASHILENEKVLDSFGHVSVRSATNPNRFFMPRAMPPALVSRADIVELDLDCKPVDANAPRTNGERFIHGEIYKARPDVNSVIHSHSIGVIPFGVAGVALRPVLAQAGFLPAETPLFEARDAQVGEKERGMLVRTPKLGAYLAKILGNAPVVLMRGHGDTVVGDTVKRATVRAAYTEINARVQLEAMRLSNHINAMDEAELAYNSIENFDVERPWDNFKRKLEEAQRRR
ncbi:MAG: class II aldolase/adducin family protein [Burkholderiales bacterium]